MAGNANSGRHRNQLISEALLVEIKAREKQGDKAGLRLLAVRVMNLAEAGERWAAEYVRDTIDGRPAQQVIHSGDADNPVDIHHHGAIAVSDTAAFLTEALGNGAESPPPKSRQN